MPNHYLNQVWFIVNWTRENIFQWNFESEYHHSRWRKCLKISSAKWQPLRRILHVSRTAYMLGALYWLLIQREFITWQKTAWCSFFHVSQRHSHLLLITTRRTMLCTHTLIISLSLSLYIYIYIYIYWWIERGRDGENDNGPISSPFY